MIALDTNVLVYAVDWQAGERHRAAKALLAGALERLMVVFPLQTLVEFFNATRRGRFQLSPAEARSFIEVWRGAAPVIAYTEDDLLSAIDAVTRHKLSFFDALLWATAAREGVSHFVTEDQQDGRRLGPVTFVNPFAARTSALLGLD